MASDYATAYPRRWWYPACASTELGAKQPLGITLMDQPIALFRDGSGTPHALMDRCPHRNVPLTLGRVEGDCLECGYHGWRFDGAGECQAVPGLSGPAPTRRVPTHHVREQDGFVWIWGDGATEPDKEPFALPVIEGRGAGEVMFCYDLHSTVHAAVENALDVPHTAFLHRGVFRGGEQRELTAVRTQVENGIEVQYLGEPVGLGRFRGKQDADLTFDHWDRFFLPSIAQVEYRIKDWFHIVNTILHLPLSGRRTRAWFVIGFRTPVPSGLATPIVFGRGWQIARQDVAMLRAQTENAERFGGERYTSTELDIIGNAIWRLMLAEDKGGNDPVEIVEKHVTFRA